MPLLPLTFAPLGIACYPATPQELASVLAAAGAAVQPDSLSMFNYGDTEPSPDLRIYPWFRTILGLPDRWYAYSGDWLAPHPVPASSSSRILWTGDLTALQTYDGGEAGTVDASHGPMWEEDTDFAGRFPIHPGTVPDSGTLVAVSTNYGVGQFTLALANMPAHTHEFNLGTGSSWVGTKNAADQQGMTQGTATTTTFNTAATGGDTGGLTTPVPLLPAARGVYLIKRTARVYYRAT